MEHFYYETGRLILRTPQNGDAQVLAAERSTDFVLRYNLYRSCTAQDIKDEFDIYPHFILELKENHTVIGCVSVRDDDFRYHMGAKEILAWLTEDCARKGYMSEALQPIMGAIFQNTERISARIFAPNKGSLALAEKLGFRKEGYLKRALKKENGEVFDVVLLSLSREEFLDTI